MVNKKSFYSVGIDIGGTKIFSCVASLTNAEVLIENYEFVSSYGPHSVIKQIIDGVYKLVPRTLIDKIKGIGIGIPGIVNSDGVVIWAPNLKDFRNVPLAREISSSLNIPTYIENDVDCAAIGEYYFGAAKGTKNFVFISIGTGIGCGIVVDGKLYRGSHNVAGAIGWNILGKEGMKCKYKTCGHLEEVVSGTALDRIAKKTFGEDSTSKTIFELYRKKEPRAIQIINEFLLYLGMEIANIISFFDPEVVVIGGGVGENKDVFFPKISQIVKKYAQPYIANKVKIFPSMLGNKAGLYGAMWLPVIFTENKNKQIKYTKWKVEQNEKVC